MFWVVMSFSSGRGAGGAVLWTCQKAGGGALPLA
jgi:hypothetical protein